MPPSQHKDSAIKISKLFALLILSTLFFCVVLQLKEARGPYFYNFNDDPEYAYLLNALNLTQGIPPHHVDHPGTPPLSDTLNQFYADHLEPYFQEAGSERGGFVHVTLTHEVYSWFGPSGAAIFFICTPLAMLRQPRCITYLLPAIVYYLLIYGCVSWMIGNGRFMTIFFIALTPALAILAFCSFVTMKATDFSRLLFALCKMVSREIEITPTSLFQYSFADGRNIWAKIINGNQFNPGNPSERLEQIPQGSTAAIIEFGHLGHSNFYIARPDRTRVPLNGNLQYGKIETTLPLGKFIQSDRSHCVVIGPMPEVIPYNLPLYCDDNYGHLITKLAKTDEL